MQRKGNAQTESSVTDMHFAVIPYEVEFIVPNDQIYCVYFQKGLQILGTTQYPIQNHEKLKTLQLPILNNIIPFRMFSDRNAQYQWSIYKRVNEMEEFLQSKKINLKQILKKQPVKQQEPQKKSRLQRKDSLMRSQSRMKNSDLKGTQQGSGQKLDLPTESTFPNNQARGCIYNQHIKSQGGQFIFKFYLIKALSSQELSRTIQEKERQSRKLKTSSSQIISTKFAQLQKVRQIDHQFQIQPSRENYQLNQLKEETLQTLTKPTQVQESIPQTQKAPQKEKAKQQIQSPIKAIQKAANNFQETDKQTPEEDKQVPDRIPQYQLTPNQQTIEAFPIDTQLPVIGTQQQKTRAEYLLQQPRHNGSETLGKQNQQATNLPEINSKNPKLRLNLKRAIVVLLIMIGLYVLYSFNIFGKEGINEKPIKRSKKQKKDKFSNRKKTNKPV